jgi:hypothetical protein
MASRTVRNPTRRDPKLIDEAPLSLPVVPEAGDEERYFEMASTLAAELDSARAELSQLKAKKTIDDVRAGMLEGYSNKVFWFVAVYCSVVGIFLALAGWGHATDFSLSDTILSIIAGSTAVSVIGLIGMVISGLFGSSPRARAKAVSKKTSP